MADDELEIRKHRKILLLHHNHIKRYVYSLVKIETDLKVLIQFSFVDAELITKAHYSDFALC